MILMKRSFFSLVLVAAAMLAPVGPAIADTVDEKPRLGIAIAGAPDAFSRAVATRLAATRRFNVVADGPGVRRRITVPLNGSLSLTSARKARTESGLELLVEGRWSRNAANVRLYDFRNGEFSRDLSLIGEANGADALANQLVAFVRHSLPLRCHLKDMADDQLILDLGAADGVTVGSLYRVYRHPANLAPVEIGLVKVASVKAFASYAEAEETAKGFSFAPGDVLVEQTADLLFK